MKRKLPAAATPSDEPKAKRKASKKHGTPAPSKETAYFQAAFAQNGVKPPSTPIGAVPTIKQEQEDGVDTAVRGRTPILSGAAAASTSNRAASKAPPVQECAVATSTTVAAPVSSGKPTRVRKAKTRTTVVDLESSDEDDSDEDDEEDESSEDEEEEDIEETEKDGGAGMNEASTAAVVVRSSKGTSALDSGNLVSVSRGCFDELEHYLYGLANLPLESPTLKPSLRGVIFHWITCGYDIEAIRGACHDSTIVEMLEARGATQARIGELSQLLLEADLVEHFASWVRPKVKQELRRFCTLLDPPSRRDEPQNPAASFHSANSRLPARTARSISRAPGASHQYEQTGNQRAVHGTSPSLPRHDSYVPPPHTSPYDNHMAGASADTPRRPKRSGRSHGNDRSRAVSVPYVRSGDAHKILLFVVGTPDTTLADADFNAHDFHSACETAYGTSCVETVSRFSENIWKVGFRSYLPDDPFKPVEYRNNKMYPGEAPRTSPNCFFSDITKLTIPDSVIFDSIATTFRQHSGTVYRLEHDRKVYIIVRFQYAPDLLRFYVPLPGTDPVNFMPAFNVCPRRRGSCLLCQTRHSEAVCPRARTLT